MHATISSLAMLQPTVSIILDGRWAPRHHVCWNESLVCFLSDDNKYAFGSPPVTPLHNTEYCGKERQTGPVSKEHNGCCLPPHLTGYEKQLDLESHSTSKPHRNTRLLAPLRTFPPL